MEDVLRDYYMCVHGFDPITDRLVIHGRGNFSARLSYRYEVGFPLASDPALLKAGVTIWAQVDFSANSPYVVKNRIIFRRGIHEASVDCVHTAIWSGSLEDFGNADTINPIELAESTESARYGDERVSNIPRPIYIAPWEHFAALKSFVAGLAELGITNALNMSYLSEENNPQTLPFGFNALFQHQVVRAMRQVARIEMDDIISEVLVNLANSVPPDWFISRLPLLDRMYFRNSAPELANPTSISMNDMDDLCLGSLSQEMRRFLFADVQRFNAIILETNSRELKQLALQWDELPEPITTLLAYDEDPEVRRAAALFPWIGLNTLDVLAHDANSQVRQIATAREMLC
ncbi:MAG TPA: hypothetical protein VKK79_15485 [Candidatus Lokiarchaeia archaeon]|nr:hypothetical protein [Candidatus Lokiarchaeia archaeon]